MSAAHAAFASALAFLSAAVVLYAGAGAGSGTPMAFRLRARWGASAARCSGVSSLLTRLGRLRW